MEPSPMTTWLCGGRLRRCESWPMSPQMNGHRIAVALREHNDTVAFATGVTIEEAHANALNALMANEGEASGNT